MRYFIFFFVVFAFIGCSNTWQGVKDDTSEAYDWSKQKVNEGANWVSEKTAD